MQNIITVGEEYVPVEQIAFIEPFEPQLMRSSNPTNRGRAASSYSTEANEFRFIPDDNVATNRMVSFRVRSFKPTQDFNPAKPYQTQLDWRDGEGITRRKLLLTKPEMVIAIVLRGETEPGAERKARRPRRPQSRAPRKRAAAPTVNA